MHPTRNGPGQTMTSYPYRRIVTRKQGGRKNTYSCKTCGFTAKVSGRCPHGHGPMSLHQDLSKGQRRLWETWGGPERRPEQSAWFYRWAVVVRWAVRRGPKIPKVKVAPAPYVPPRRPRVTVLGEPVGGKRRKPEVAAMRREGREEIREYLQAMLGEDLWNDRRRQSLAVSRDRP